MGRNIDFTQPLSADDAQFVNDRPWMLRDATAMGVEVQYESDEFSTEPDEDETGDPSALEGEAAEEDEESTDDEEAGDEDDVESEESDGEEDEEEADDNEASDELLPYAEWVFEELKGEAESRGLAKNGSKAQLVARLTEHDKSTEA